MVAIPNLPLRRKTPAHTPPADAPESIVEAVPPAVSTPTAPRMPSQGHTQDDDDFNVPPPPATPNGTYLCRVKNVYVPINKDTGKWEKWDNGDDKPMKIFFTIDDPAEQRKQAAGKENCWGADIDIKVDLVGNFYSQTLAHLTTLGAPRITWPKNAKGNATMPLLAEHIMVVTKGKKFSVTVKPEPGKGANKTKLFNNVKSITAPPAPPKAAPKPAPAASVAEAEPDPIDTNDDDANTVLPGDAEVDGDGIPF